MKKTLSINLSGSVFNIDDDAYQLLRDYLNLIERHFGNEEESKEIISDIEARIAELFKERITDFKHVITISDVEEIIDIMGQPEEIIDPGDADQYGKKERFGPSGYRRMYRDPDNRIFGGVCSGMAAYWGTDPLIIRIIFVVATLIFLSGAVIYLILWIVLPEAKTTAQKLEMRGEPVNISNIGKAVKEEFETIKKKMKF
jgi:phage shock protein PspC (stress-responsive transcriptional regulator)